MDPDFIVAEVSKNWYNWHAALPRLPLVSQAFEHVIETNLARGYRLHSFQLHRLMTRPDELNETIVAVFERIRT